MVYERVKEFKKKFPATIAWRLKAHSSIVEKHLNPDEEVLYAFAAQKNDTYVDIMRTFVVVLTNKRIVLAQKRMVFGYFFLSITPDLFNDLTVEADMVWGTIVIDTIREQVKLTNIQKEALPEIETAISTYMMNAKQRYIQKETAQI